MRTRLLTLSVAISTLVLCGAPSALGVTMVLDADDVSDWARVYSSSSWKHKDACLHPNALVKFDLSSIGPVSRILDARLYLFVERTEPGVTLEVSHVSSDAWTYGASDPDTLWNWPVWHTIGSVAVGDTALISMDVTEHLREEIQGTGAGPFSIKITSGSQPYPRVRISSPLATVQRMRPRIVVEYEGPLGIPSFPDLAVSTADLRFSTMRPAPGQAVMVGAAVRNTGPGDAINVPVEFWDGAPGAGGFIGTAIVPLIPAGGGTALASVGWTAARGLHEIYAVADPANVIGETDETNNADFRSYLVTDPDGYVNGIESFEYPGPGAWRSDFDVPKQFTYPGPKSFYLNRSGGEAYHGDHAIEMFLDGTADDGTIWIEGAWPVDPGSAADVEIDFELFRYFADMAFFPVVSVGVLDPEQESDFEILPFNAQEGWLLHSYRTTVSSGPFDMIHVAVGITVSWETPGTFYLDLVRTAVRQRPLETDPPDRAGPPVALFQNRPNPMSPLTTIAYRLDADAAISLRIFDPAGRLVATLREGTETGGFHEVHWDGVDDAGRAMPSGVYLYELRTPRGTDQRKLLLVR